MEEEGKDTDRKASSGNRNGQIYFIGGVRVPFPAKAYPSQITMMHKIIRGLERKQNCLLESPTGSGKTLALLCSSLAWQKHEREKAKTPKSSGEKKTETLVSHNNESGEHSKYFDANKKDLQDPVKDEAGAKFASPIPVPTSSFASKSEQQNLKNGDVRNDDSDPDFQSAKKRFRTPSGALPNSKKHKSMETTAELVPNVDLKGLPVAPPNWKMELTTDMAQTPEALIEEEKLRIFRKNMGDEEKMKQEKPPRIPRIYFGTRTHKQIAQIVRELKKTEFKTCRMTILSSREHSCIHPKVSKGKDKNEECRRHVKGIEGKSCRYHQNASLFCRPSELERYNLNTSWDIEDLVTAGKKAMACPYYAARELMENADIIFCPYNYLVDPHIRSTMSIDITDEIIVLDEAHNIEDSARDAASITVTSTQLEETMEELNKLIYFRVLADSHQAMHTLCSIIHQWLQSLSDSLTRTGFETAAKVFPVDKMVARLETIQITPSTFPVYKEEFAKITAAEIDPYHISNIDAPNLTTKAKTTINGLIVTLEKVLDKEKRYSDDFRIAVSRKSSTTRKLSDMGGGWKTSRNAVSKSWEYSLNVWCLNPAVVFSGIGTTARCIVLTSGTLSPMSSFSSELGVSFPIQLEANHVIQDSQAWVGALTVGPDNKNIIANYQSSETFAFQDGVGRIILQVCQIVPHGVLCFFASYSMLEKLKRRWMSTGLWEDICRKKDTYSEPRGSDRFALDEIMQEFYHSCTLSDNHESSRNGALLLAVCRGKISEGLDFSDDNARAVITIGIPFPDFKDPQCELKRKYNSDHCAARGLLNGSEWYEIQAYRALNQALGRCIRHRKDWGAIILVDERFGRSPKYKNGLSKWVRGRCRLFNDFHECISSVAAFAEARRLDPCPGLVKTESSISSQKPEQNPSIAPASNGSTSCCDTKSSSAFISPDAVKTPQITSCQDVKSHSLVLGPGELRPPPPSTSCLDTKSTVFIKQEEPSTPQITSCQDVKSHSLILGPGELRPPPPSTSCLDTKSTGVFVKQEPGTPQSTSCQNTNNTYMIIKPNALGTHQVTSCQETKLHSTIVRPDELRTPQIKGQQNPPRNLNIELKSEENSNTVPKTGPMILNIANQPLQNLNTPIRLVPIQLVQNVNVGQAKCSPNLSMAPSVANNGSNKIPIAPLKDTNEPIRLVPIQHLQNVHVNQVKCSENIYVASSTVPSGNARSSSDSIPGRKCLDSWKNTTNVVSSSNQGDRKETPPCVSKHPPEQSLVNEKPRYNSFDELLKPIIQSSQSTGINVSEDSKPGRVNLFKTTSLCNSETVVKEEKSAAHKAGLGGKQNPSNMATKSLVNLENDGFLEDFNDKELNEIDFDAFEPKKMNANVVKTEPGACSTRENSPNLFSNSSLVMEDVDGSVVKEETGNECWFDDYIDKSIEASWDDGFLIPEELKSDAEGCVCDKEVNSSKSKNANCKIEDFKARKKRSKRRYSAKKLTEKSENSSKLGKKSEDLQDKHEACECDETPKVGRKRVSSRRQSNLRMSSRKKKGDTSSDIDFNEVGDQELDMPANKCKSIVSCLYCNCLFTKTDNPRPTEVKSSVLPSRSGSASKGIKILESSLKNLKNFRQNVKQHDCECKMNGLELNSILSEEESMVFIPLFCDSCYNKRKPKISLIGFKFIRIGSPSEKVETPNSSDHDVWLLADKITISKEK